MWDTEMVILLRHMIDDLETTPKYDDDRLMQLLLVSAQLVKVENSFTTSYDIDIENYTLSPDPTKPEYRDDAFINLTVLKAACLLAGSGLGKGITQSILVVEGPHRFDGRGQRDARKFQVQTWCAAYNSAKNQYAVNGDGSCPGEAIIGPYRSMQYVGSYFYGPDIRELRP